MTNGAPATLVNDAPAFVSTDTPIDLANCDREPIHIPGAVQPHGLLIALEQPTLSIAMASASMQEHLGVAPASLLGTRLEPLIGSRATEQVRALIRGTVERKFDVIVTDGGPAINRRFEASVHRSDGLVLLELEPEADGAPLTLEGLTATMRSTLAHIERADSLEGLTAGIAAEMRAITGFDRVWVYRFHPDWHGEIIAESKREDIETWLGMRYPATDIPAQARALFLRNWVRTIPDIGFTPSPLVPTLNPLTGRPLDLGGSGLRSVSPIHIEYLSNMGVTGSLVISLIHRGKLWGLISGHHYSGSKRVSYATRSLCEFLAQALSLQIGLMDQLGDRDYTLEVRGKQSRLVEQLGTDAMLESALTAGPVTLAELTRADGAAICRGREITLVGSTPTEEQIRALATWLRSQPGIVVESNALALDFPPAADYTQVASGLLAVPLSVNRADQLLWFRREQRQTVRWAGDPHKAISADPNESVRLHPRRSFALWEEEARGTASPWRPTEVEAALELRRTILDFLIRVAEEMARLNAELESTNAQLEQSALELQMQADELLIQREYREALLESERDAREQAERANRARADFLGVVSHELRTPLNAIGGYAQLMSFGVRGPVTADQQSDLERIRINQRHLLDLISGILNFTQLEAGAMQFTITDVPVAPLLDEMDALIGPQMRAKSLTFHVRACPDSVVVRTDKGKLRQILLNLLTNAQKFTPEHGIVELGCDLSEAMACITVRDTGPGIPAASLDAIFSPFVQMDRDRTPLIERGVGLGLAISRELARGIGAELSVVSTIGEGSTFALSLPTSA